MDFLTRVFSSMPLHRWVAVIMSALGIAAICLRVFESDGKRAKRTERNKKKELRSLAERISSYARTVHQRYPTGDVIVSEQDVAEEFRKRPDAVITALNLRVSEQESPTGYVEGILEIEHVIPRAPMGSTSRSFCTLAF